MKIAVNTRLLLKNKLEGIGWFTYETMKRITTWHSEHEFIFIFDRPWDDSFIFNSNITPVKVPPQSRHPVLWYIWFEKSVPAILKKYNADVFVSPDGYLSLNAQIPSVSIIHDINFCHIPKSLPFLKSKYYKHFFPKFARKADRIATVSNYSKQDITKTFQIPEDKIDVVYNGINTIYRPLSESEKHAVKKEYTNGEDYFIYIGSLHPRKNITRLLKAYEKFRNFSEKPLKLVIVGEKMFKSSSIKKSYTNNVYKQDIIFTGRLQPETLRQVLGGAYALTFVPSFEGFGIPILEAMNCDVPVITSNVTSMPEVTEDAGILVNPYSQQSIADAMLSISRDSALRNTIIENGRRQREKFSWDITARYLWESIEKSLKN